MKGFRRRVLLPLVIPLGATALFVAVVFNLSRILLILEERRSDTVATGLAIAAAVAILAGFTWFAGRPEARKAGLSMLGSVGLVLVFAGGYSFGAAGEGEGHGEEKEAAALGGVVDIAGKEFAFEPKEATVPAGPVTINLTNTGKVVHTIMLENVPTFTKIAAPKAGTATGTADLKPGTYIYFCDEAGHRKAGMEGTLTVTEGGGGGGPKAGPATADLAGKEFAFTPKELSVPAGPVKFNLRNDGKVVHTVLIEGVPELAKIVAPKGGTASGTVDLKPGSYLYFCDEAGHRKAGMEGTLTVTKGGAATKVAGAAAGKAGGATKDVVGKEFLFEPKELSVPAGPVTFNLKNDGKVVHTLAIEGVPAFTKISAPKGGTATGKADLAPGTYKYFCDEAGHRKAGMEGTLQVG